MHGLTLRQAMWSFSRYVLLSTLAATAVVYHAFYTREQYFPSMVYLSASKFSVAVLGNLAFAAALCFYRLTTKLFFGTLRDGEIERLNERVSAAIMETCLAMTIFREEFNVAFVVMFAVVTFVKIFHWLVQDRVDYMEITPHVSRWQRARILLFMLLLLNVDIQFFEYTVHKVIQSGGRTVMLLFAFEYLIQSSSIISSLAKYGFAVLDGYLEGRWESKGVCVFYLELLTDLIQLCVYLLFFGIVLMQYGLPIHLIRDLCWTIRNFQNRVRDFLKYRKITSRMDLFPNADEADLERSDHACIICREEMTMSTINKKLGCTHVFHVHCLRSWLERQQNCPICRNPVFPPTERERRPRQPRQENRPADQQPQPDPPAIQGANNNQQNQEANPPPVAIEGEGAAQQPILNPTVFPGQSQPEAPQQPVLPAQWNGQPLGIMWNYPNGLPITSMATFANGQIQYAGQQNPEPVMNYGQPNFAALPFVPVLSSFSAPITLMAPPGSMAERRFTAATAVAAAAYSPYTGLVMMPPVTYIPNTSETTNRSGGNEDASTSAAQAAAAASAASGVAAAFSGSASFTRGEQSSLEATLESVQRQLEFLQAQMTRGEDSAQEMPQTPVDATQSASTSSVPPETSSSSTVASSTMEPPVPSERIPEASSSVQQHLSAEELRERRVRRLQNQERED